MLAGTKKTDIAASKPADSPEFPVSEATRRSDAKPIDAGGTIHRTVIEPAPGWQLINIGELWRYRELLFFLAWRDVKVRYKQTVLGAAWAVLQPAMMMVVFVIFFGRLAGLPTGGVPAPLFYLSGLLPWFLFSTAVTSASNSVVTSERLITKIYFPRLAVPFAAVAASAVDFLVACGLLAVVMFYYVCNGECPPPTWNLLLAPVTFAIIAVFASGLGALLSALNVAYRDFRYVIPFMIQVGMFATPTIYMSPSGNEGRSVAWLLWINPMTSLVSTFRAAVIGGTVPWGALTVACAVAGLSLAVGCLYFRKIEDRFADII
jgi:homopolymeric O-antigen transport system permease protein